MCGDVKPAGTFYKHPKNLNGLQSRCKTCMKAAYDADAPRRIEYNRQHRWEDQRVRMASGARRADKAAGRESHIEAKHIVVPEFCPVTGEPMWHSVKTAAQWSPCLVRIDKTLGFVQGNWRVVSANSIVGGGRRGGQTRIR